MARCKTTTKTTKTTKTKSSKAMKTVLDGARVGKTAKMWLRSKIKACYIVIGELSNNPHSAQDNATEVAAIGEELRVLEAEYLTKYPNGLTDGDYHPNALLDEYYQESVVPLRQSATPASPRGVCASIDTSMFQSTRL